MPITEIQSQKYILVVDDLPDNQFLVRLALEQEGHQIIAVGDGITALKQIEKSPPNLILLDVMMPEMDGYEVTRRIRSNPNLPFIPIILITAHQQNSVVEGLDAGADEFIHKPFQIDELQARVRCLLRLKETIEQRESFVSCLTHDLRTPLVAIDRMLLLIKQGCFGNLSDTVQEALTNIGSSNQNLLALLNNLLEVYGYEVGQKCLNFKSFDLWELIKEVCTELFPLADEKNLALDLDNTAQREEIVGDRLELRRVIVNLVSNAIKFTDSGKVKISLKSAPSKVIKTDGYKISSPILLIEVEDTGIGISTESKHKIFDRFRQGNHKRSGHGLGLYLCYKIVESHYGQIEVESEEEKGSLFKIYLPVNSKS